MSASEWQACLQRMARGDVGARNEIVTEAYERLRRLAGHMLK
jgi:hypothetical protein